MLKLESEIQQASADCGGDPSWWHALDEPTTEIEVSEFIGALARCLQPETCVETGSYYGQTSRAIGEALRRNGHGKLYALEIHPPYAEATRHVCRGFPVEVVECDARQWIPPVYIDFAFIDTGAPADRDQDILHLLPHLSPHAVLAVHDSGTVGGLRPKLLDLEARGIVKLLLLPTPRGVALLRKG